MADTEIDWWHVGSVAALALIAVTDIVVPAKMLGPLIGGMEKLADGEATAAELRAALPSMVWPVVALALGLAVAGVGAWRMYSEQSVEGRWLWVVSLGAAMALWSAGVMAALGKAEHTIARMTAGL